MKKLYSFIVFALLFTTFANYSAQAQIGFGVFGGLSTPSDEINNVYNSDKLSGGALSMLRDGAKSGYNIGAKIRLPLVAGIMLTGGVAWNRFPESSIDVTNPTTKAKIATLKTVQDIIPISAGINYYIFNTGIGIYGTGELSYNYNKNTVNAEYNGIDVPLNLDKSPSYSRVGAGLGAGLDINAILFLANVEAKYNFSNIIGRESGEDLKSYFTLSVGIYLGTAGAR
jgi:hypothetical protein